METTAACSPLDGVAGATDISLTDDLLVFGYGSLVWRPALPFTASHPSTVAGYVRRLWQQSPDHRGVPGATGRVATLVPLPGSAAVTAGTVFIIPARDAAAALTSLVEREIAGYAAVQVVAMGDDGVARSAVAFTATPTNEYWAGPRCWRPRVAGDGGSQPGGGDGDAVKVDGDDELVYCEGCATCGTQPSAAVSPPRPYGVTAVARVVLTARGHSGSNAEYVTRLRDALAERGVVDCYLERVHSEMGRLAEGRDGGGGGAGGGGA